LNVVLDHCHPLHKVTIIPRGQSLGSTMSLPKEDLYNHHKKQMLDTICMTMGGRIAEEMFSGDISSGAAGDIQQATKMARAMVTQFGMSEQLGMVQYGEGQEYVFLGRDMARSAEYSEDTAQKIDQEVRQLIDTGYQRAVELLTSHKDKLDAIANALLEYETLSGEQVEEIMNTGTLTPPPTGGATEPLMGAEATTPVPPLPTKEPPEIDPGLGAAAPAPA
jgi:cell division protease FtsH